MSYQEQEEYFQSCIIQNRNQYAAQISKNSEVIERLTREVSELRGQVPNCKKCAGYRQIQQQQNQIRSLQRKQLQNARAMILRQEQPLSAAIYTDLMHEYERLAKVNQVLQCQRRLLSNALAKKQGLQGSIKLKISALGTQLQQHGSKKELETLKISLEALIRNYEKQLRLAKSNTNRAWECRPLQPE